MGRRLAYTYHASGFLTLQRLVMRTAEGPFPMDATYNWRDAGPGRTLMTLANCGQPAGFARLFATFMAVAVRRANRKDLAGLKALVERS